MHEYSLVRALLDRVDAEVERREATAVYRIRVRLGELSGVDPELFERAFEMARIPTASATAELEFPIYYNFFIKQLRKLAT